MKSKLYATVIWAADEQIIQGVALEKAIEEEVEENIKKQFLSPISRHQ